MILSAQSIKAHCNGTMATNLINPFHERSIMDGLSYGLSSCGYDVRVERQVILEAGEFSLASTLERFMLPNYLVGRICDKSTWARRGVMVQNTVIEPGWRGYLTLELTNHSKDKIIIKRNYPIAQILFEILDYPTEQPYPPTGKYQNQLNFPVGPKDEL